MLQSKRKRWAALLTAQIGIVVACGGDGDGGGSSTTAGPGSSPEGLRGFAAAVCDFYERCDSPIARAYGVGDECTDAYVFVTESQIHTEPATAELYAALGNCATGLRAATCPASKSSLALSRVFLDQLATCLPARAGLGDPCGDAAPCGIGFICRGEQDGQCGTCRAPNPAACEDERDCDLDEFCDANGSCATRKPVGAACSYGSECEAGYCDDTDQCRARAREGEPCTTALVCEELLNCVGGVCAAPAGEGEPCEGGTFACRVPFACFRGTCVAHERWDNPIGGACSFIGACVAEGYCDDGECVAAARVGQPCAGGTECVKTAYCDASDLCVALGPDGAACQGDDECESGTCVTGACVAPASCE